jgi:hypothetical protein
MAEPKTRPTGASVAAYIEAITDKTMRADAVSLADMMRRVTGTEPEMWGEGMVGFGRYRYRYASGRQGEWFLTGFAARTRELTVYVTAGFDLYDDLLTRLGRHRTGKSCLYVKRLADVDLTVLEELLEASVAHLRKINGEHDQA